MVNYTTLRDMIQKVSKTKFLIERLDSQLGVNSYWAGNRIGSSKSSSNAENRIERLLDDKQSAKEALRALQARIAPMMEQAETELEQIHHPVIRSVMHMYFLECKSIRQISMANFISERCVFNYRDKGLQTLLELENAGEKLTLEKGGNDQSQQRQAV